MANGTAPGMETALQKPWELQANVSCMSIKTTGSNLSAFMCSEIDQQASRETHHSCIELDFC